MDPIVDSFLQRANRAPDDPIAVAPDRTTSAREVEALAREWASQLQAADLPAGTPLALVSPNGPEYCAGFLALRLAGHPVLLIDHSTPHDERLRIAEGLGACGTAVIEQALRIERVPNAGGTPLDNICALKMTSGSTGEPCGIAVTAEALLADTRALIATMGLGQSERYLATIPMSHSYGFSVLTLPVLTTGGVLICPDFEDAFVIAERHAATVFPSVPAWFASRLRLDDRRMPPSLRLLISAGAPLSAQVARDFREEFGVPIHVFYGASESGGISYDTRGDAAERGTLGEPIAGVQIELLQHDTDTGGRLRVRSHAVASAYHPADARPGDKLNSGTFTTDDIVTLKDGELVLHGRVGDWINIRGKKVNPREVESVIAQLEGVREVAVLGHAVPGGTGEVVRAVVACEPGELQYLQVSSWCRERLAPHKVPRSVQFVSELPRTARGKLDRNALRASE